MREIESKPIPRRSKGLTGDLKRLKSPTDSFLIENKGLKRAVLYSTASRLGIRLITREEGDGLRVWRNFNVGEVAVKSYPRSLISADPKPSNVEPLDGEWDGWSDERSTVDQDAGETIYYREHLKTRKYREIRRETYYG